MQASQRREREHAPWFVAAGAFFLTTPFGFGTAFFSAFAGEANAGSLGREAARTGGANAPEAFGWVEVSAPLVTTSVCGASSSWGGGASTAFFGGRPDGFFSIILG